MVELLVVTHRVTTSIRVDQFDVQPQTDIKKGDRLIIERLTRLRRAQQPCSPGRQIGTRVLDIGNLEAQVVKPAPFSHEIR